MPSVRLWPGLLISVLVALQLAESLLECEVTPSDSGHFSKCVVNKPMSTQYSFLSVLRSQPKPRRGLFVQSADGAFRRRDRQPRSVTTKSDHMQMHHASALHQAMRRKALRGGRLRVIRAFAKPFCKVTRRCIDAVAARVLAGNAAKTLMPSGFARCGPSVIAGATAGGGWPVLARSSIPE
jgi:hypothetical protein